MASSRGRDRNSVQWVARQPNLTSSNGSLRRGPVGARTQDSSRLVEHRANPRGADPAVTAWRDRAEQRWPLRGLSSSSRPRYLGKSPLPASRLPREQHQRLARAPVALPRGRECCPWPSSRAPRASLQEPCRTSAACPSPSQKKEKEEKQRARSGESAWSAMAPPQN